MKQHGVNQASSMPMLRRRDVLHLMGGATAVSILGGLRRQSALAKPGHSTTQTAAVPICVVKPEQMEGPYFVDDRLNRSDIRADPSNGTVKPGVPLQLVLQVSQFSQRGCIPFSGAMVDVWHCDANGIYADVQDPGFNTVGRKFLRGYQMTDASGMVRFTTIYPGWYPGRAIHIHFKIRTAGASQPKREFTSQLYFDDQITDRVHRQPPYSSGKNRDQPRTRNQQDGIFQGGGEQLILQLSPAASGYIGKFALALEPA